jgi:hypothetical protein
LRLFVRIEHFGASTTGAGQLGDEFSKPGHSSNPVRETADVAFDIGRERLPGGDPVAFGLRRGGIDPRAEGPLRS